MNDTIRRLLIAAASEIETLTEEMGDEGDAPRGLVERLRAAAAGKVVSPVYLVRQRHGGDLVEVCLFRLDGRRIEVATIPRGFDEMTAESVEFEDIIDCEGGEPLDTDMAARMACEWTVEFYGDDSPYDPGREVIVTG